MKKISLSIVIPAYNEEDNIKESVFRAEKTALRTRGDYEIIVLNDGSTDKTGQYLSEVAINHPKLKIFSHEFNQGIEPTIKDLYRLANKELIFLNAADNEISFSILPDLLRELQRGADIVVAKRIIKEYNLTRRFVSWAYNFSSKALFRVETYDAGCAKLVRADIYKHLKVRSTSVFAEAERLIRASRAGYKIESIPVTHFPKKGQSSFRLRDVFSSLKDLLLLFLELNFRA